jgi:hypothetical protein
MQACMCTSVAASAQSLCKSWCTRIGPLNINLIAASLHAAQQIARAISERGGGQRHVEVRTHHYWPRQHAAALWSTLLVSQRIQAANLPDIGSAAMFAKRRTFCPYLGRVHPDDAAIISCFHMSFPIIGEHVVMPECSGVQAMALEHDDGYEVACNLLDASATPASVQAACRKLAASHGLSIAHAYSTGLTQAEALQRAERAGI